MFANYSQKTINNMSSILRSLGIIGAGKLGITLARIARMHDFEVFIAGSGEPNKIKLSVDVLAPGAVAMSAHDVAEHADMVVLALPLGKFRTLPNQALAGKLVIDAMNHWWEVDGSRESIVPNNQSSSEAVQEFLTDSRVVKALNHMGYHDLFDEHKPEGTPNRKAIAIAGNDESDVRSVAILINGLGFDPVLIGSLHQGVKLEPGTHAFGASVGENKLHELIDTEQL